MKILLVYHFQGNFSMVGMEPLGLMQLGRALLDQGHEIRYVQLGKKDIRTAMREFSPRMVAYSLCSTHHEKAVRLNRELKTECDFYAVFGGPHPTFFPELIEEHGVDAICVGEGDNSFPEFVRLFESGDDVSGVANMWVKLGPGEVARNAPEPLIEDLDVFAYPDREVLYQDRWFREYSMKSFITSRGCPFACTYCYNRLYRELYKGCGRVWRFRSPGHVVGEIEEVKQRWPLAMVNFVDDVFVPSKEWLVEFAEEYRARIGLPYTCFLRLDRIDKELARLLSESGCGWVFAAVESGDEEIRHEVLGRKMTDAQILAGCEALHEHGIKVFTQNMLGVPGETVESALKTLGLNVRCKSDLVITSLFAPFPNLELTKRSIEEGYFSGDPSELPRNMTSRSVLKLPDKALIERLQKLMPALVDLPWLRRWVQTLIRLPLHPLYSMVRNAWMSTKIYRNLAFRPTIKEQLEMLYRGGKYILFDR